MISARDRTTRVSLRQLPAPQGWTAALLPMEYPASIAAVAWYRPLVAELLQRLPSFELSPAHEVFLQFDRCRPHEEILTLQQNARLWLPEIGLGVWLDREPPTLWSTEEFLRAAPGELRPLIYRVLRVQPTAVAQASAWNRLLGSGVLMRVAGTEAGRFVQGATEFLQPNIQELSLTSFPFYVPLLTEAALNVPDAAFLGSLSERIPSSDGYLRESAEDGGLLILARQSAESFFDTLRLQEMDVDAVRLLPAQIGSTAKRV